MFAVFNLDIHCGEYEFTYEHWIGEEKDTEQELRQQIKEYLRTFYDDAEISKSAFHSKDDLFARYETFEIAYNLGSLEFFEKKEDAVKKILDATRVY